MTLFFALDYRFWKLDARFYPPSQRTPPVKAGIEFRHNGIHATRYFGVLRYYSGRRPEPAEGRRMSHRNM